ncbi:hypothetical protein N0V82_010181 [Gnomoniopsis sp. IMI 355080]|nr:hypothetical protein N0V82_010181 [Gnomoniopsis sp. IMI 355080]
MDTSGNVYIRILILLQGTETEPLECSLEKCLLDDASHHEREYEALSYCWGLPDRNASLNCSGSSLKITETMDVVLRVLRYSDKPRRLWIDQLCINQDDDEEKSQQVRSMRQIYSSAKRTLVWLGPDEQQQGPTVLNLFFRFSRLFRKLSKIGRRRPSINDFEDTDEDEATPLNISLEELCDFQEADLRDEEMRVNPDSIVFPRDNMLKECGLPLRSSEAWKAFDSLLNTKYFTRVWTLQEVLNSRSAVVLWGRTEMPWTILRQSHRWTTRNYCMMGHYVDGVLSSPELSVAPFLTTEYHWFRGERFWTLAELVISGRHKFEATKPRDQIFALVSLASDGQEFEISYDKTKTEEDIFRDFAEHVIRSDDLTMLNYAAIQVGDSTRVLPSWVPNWSPRVTPERPFEYDEPMHPIEGGHDGIPRDITNFAACGRSSRARLGTTDRPEHLLIRGIQIDQARVICTEKLHSRDSFHTSIAAQYTELVANTSSPSTLILAMIRCMALTDVAIDSTWDNDGILVYFIGKCMNSMRDRALLDPETDNSNGMSLIRLASRGMKCNPPPAKTGLSALSESTKSWLKDFIASAHENELGQEQVTLIVDAISQHWSSAKSDMFSAEVQIYGSGRKFFVTTKGHIGLGPAKMSTTDVIVILYGGNTPYVLRPVPNTERYTLVGDCYIDGLMHGEAVDTVPESAAKWFCIV